ncbi:helix-turn-helix domain-containing protein [Chryseobacterium nematophagum]|uniref:Helix-turn-helix domain-containing protein n=2 Tax=Chryseobacterium nematophagum TaxID=2305228 RepID=A0A3M7TEA5_9FLAO|nr:helix-turn-helix domain-containing protein [Chryseobacterium nematophagum]
MFKSLLKIVFLFVMILFPAQKKNIFDQVYEKSISDIHKKEASQLIKRADSLYISAKMPLDKVKVLMASANAYQQLGDIKKSICYAEKANIGTNHVDNPEWGVRIQVFLAQKYRLVGLYERSKKYTSEGFQRTKSIEDSIIYYQLLGELYQEMAYYESNVGNHEKAIYNLRQSLWAFEKVNDPMIVYHIANSYQLLGGIFSKQQNYELSEKHYVRADSLLKGSSFLSGWIYNGLGEIRLKQKKWAEAKLYLDKAEHVAEDFSHFDLKKAVYANINDYYEGINDSYKASLYTQKYVKVYDESNAKNPIFSRDVATTSKRMGHISIAKNIMIIVLCMILISLIIFFKVRQKQQHIKFKNIIRKQKKQNQAQDVVELFHIVDMSQMNTEYMNDIVIKKRNEPLMTSETEAKLLEFLDDFEKGNLYNNKNMSLPFLAGELNTNTKYLSYVINQHKSADFKTYINRLRIHYIVDKLLHDDRYRQYKISILAEECGFSSHSKFASVFKMVTNFSPSVYIKLLESGNSMENNIHFPENN